MRVLKYRKINLQLKWEYKFLFNSNQKQQSYLINSLQEKLSLSRNLPRYLIMFTWKRTQVL